MAERRDRPRFDNLTHAVLEGSADDVRQLLAAGSDPDEREEWDEPTPLMVAAARGRLDVVEALVAAGADVDATQADDRSGELDQFPFLNGLFEAGRLRALFPLAYAALYGHDGVYDYLAARTALPRRREAEAVRAARPAGLTPRPYGAPEEEEKPKSAPQVEREELLAGSAAARRWVRACALCGGQGYRPGMPEEIDRRGTAGRVRRLFRPLAAGRDYLCEQCAQKADRAEAKLRERRAAAPQGAAKRPRRKPGEGA